MLFLIVVFCIHGIWGTYPILPFIYIHFVLLSFWFVIIKLFKHASNNELFPLPISPIIPTSSFGLIIRDIFLSTFS